MTEQRIQRYVDDGVGVIRLTRPEARNAIDNAMYGELDQAFAWLENDPSVGAGLLCGDGPSFCSGRDRRDIANPPEGVTLAAYLERSQHIRMRQIGLSKPLLAAVHGVVLGAGAQLALGADFRLAGDSFQIGFPENSIGLVVDTGASALLTGLAGPARAKWMLLSGERIDALEALSWGLVDWVVPDADLFATALARAKRLASAPRVSSAHAKALVDAQWTPGLSAALRGELVAQTLLMQSPEFLERRQ